MTGDIGSNDNQGTTGFIQKTADTRRLTNKLSVAFDRACSEDDLDVVWRLLRVMETLSRRPQPAILRRDHSAATLQLVDAHERLWEMRHLHRVTS
jgi:hypothetical protein